MGYSFNEIREISTLHYNNVLVGDISVSQLPWEFNDKVEELKLKLKTKLWKMNMMDFIKRMKLT